MKWLSLATAVCLAALLLWFVRTEEAPVLRVAQASTVPEAVEEAPLPWLVEPATPEESEPRRLVQSGRVVSAPTGCVAAAGSYDLVLHFHGAPVAIEDAIERSGLEAAVVIVNLGIGSGVYEQAFSAPEAFGRFVQEVSNTLTRLCPRAEAPKRIALSGWSAGYGAVWRILERHLGNPLVDAVLLSDGLHAGFMGESRERELDATKLEPFALFADLAQKGHKLMAITHTAIQTIDYGSTTETSNFLLERAGIVREARDAAGPRPTMRLTSEALLQDFHVLGFAGGDKQAHADQLHSIGDTLLPLLRQHWHH